MESNDRLSRSFGFGHHLQIGIALNYGNNALSDDGMIIDAQNCDSPILRQNESSRLFIKPIAYHRSVWFARDDESHRRFLLFS
jgi:hypothetical protein